MSWGKLAKTYWLLEYCSFGPLLWRCRIRLLAAFHGKRRALLLGDGDGRFTATLLNAHPRMTAISVDGSRGMISQARRTCKREADPARVSWVQADVRALPILAPPDFREPFDLIVSHFVLDCLTEAEIESLSRQLRAICAPRAAWLISEFQPKPTAVHTALLRGMYLFFGVVAGLPVRSLPNYGRALEHDGWRCVAKAESLNGWLTSEIWEQAVSRGTHVLPTFATGERVLPDAW